LRALYTKYKGNGLVVIGQHIGDDAQTRSLTNLKNKIAELKINYVVIQDLTQENWYARDSQYVPTYYLIDRQGNLRYKQVGGGNPTLEQVILELLNETVSESQP
jgi:hypothetical protein